MSADLAIGSGRINLCNRNAALLGGLLDLDYLEDHFGYASIPVAELRERIRRSRPHIHDKGAVSRPVSDFWIDVGLRPHYWSNLFDRIETLANATSPNAQATILL